ncbi:MAG: FGGY family carbohydrate kinase [Acidimicrobiales bacterium]
MNADLALGVDVGTTTIKAAVFELPDAATPLALAQEHAPTATPRPGWFETDPRLVLEIAVRCIRRAVGQVDAARVRALGISGTASGAWLVDGEGQPVGPAILWNDGRAADTVSRWGRDDTLARVFDISGNVLYPGYTLPVLGWLRDHEPERLAAAAKVLCCKDWLRCGLTGELLTDETDAAYVPCDIRNRAWSPALLALCGVEELVRLLPDIAPPRHTSPLVPAVADATGLPPGLPVALGATDIIAGIVGAGAVAPGHAVTILGTSAVSTVVTEAPLFEPRLIGIMATSPLGRWTRSLVNTAGSMTLDWTAGLITAGDVGALIQKAEVAAPGAGGLVFLPYLSPAGVVSPFVDPLARGVLAGLRVDQRPEDVARATVEGLAFAVADCYAHMPVPVVEVTAIGGAARSDLLLQTIADATGAAIHRPAGAEFGARGVALLAAWATGAWETDAELEEAARAVGREHTFTPVPYTTSEALARYRATTQATRELWARW